MGKSLLALLKLGDELLLLGYKLLVTLDVIILAHNYFYFLLGTNGNIVSVCYLLLQSLNLQSKQHLAAVMNFSEADFIGGLVDWLQLRAVPAASLRSTTLLRRLRRHSLVDRLILRLLHADDLLRICLDVDLDARVRVS